MATFVPQIPEATAGLIPEAVICSRSPRRTKRFDFRTRTRPTKRTTARTRRPKAPATTFSTSQTIFTPSP